MAKVLTPPSIPDLDGLLALLVHPEKGVDYLKQLQQMRDAIVDGLEMVKTKEAADALLARASEVLAAAKVDAEALIKDGQVQRQRAEQDAQKVRHATSDAQTQLDARMKRVMERERDMQAKQKQLDDVSAAQAARAQELAGLQITLDGRASYLEQEETKLKHLKSLMASHGV